MGILHTEQFNITVEVTGSHLCWAPGNLILKLHVLPLKGLLYIICCQVITHLLMWTCKDLQIQSILMIFSANPLPLFLVICRTYSNSRGFSVKILIFSVYQMLAHTLEFNSVCWSLIQSKICHFNVSNHCQGK